MEPEKEKLYLKAMNFLPSVEEMTDFHWLKEYIKTSGIHLHRR